MAKEETEQTKRKWQQEKIAFKSCSECIQRGYYVVVVVVVAVDDDDDDDVDVDVDGDDDDDDDDIGQ